MTVDVGYSGAPFLPEVLPKIERAAHFKADNGLGYTIQIDGACNRRSYRALTQAGAEMFVLGNTGLFGLAEDLGHRLADVRGLVARTPIVPAEIHAAGEAGGLEEALQLAVVALPAEALFEERQGPFEGEGVAAGVGFERRDMVHAEVRSF